MRTTKIRPQQPISYVFPVQVPESVMITAKDAYISKAVLMVGERMISVIHPTYEQMAEEPAPPILLDFLGGPLHGALVNNARIILYLHENNSGVPSITFQVLDKSITWDTLVGDVYSEDVTAGSDQGPVCRTLMYRRDGQVGYVRNASPSLVSNVSQKS